VCGGVAVEARVDEIGLRQALRMPCEQRQVGVHGHVEVATLRQVDDVAEVGAHHRLAAREAQPADAHLA
jgi:hypothetical protein